MASELNFNYAVDVCVWMARDEYGTFTDGFGEFVNGFKDKAIERCGHISLKIYPTKEMQEKYPSLIREGTDYIYVSLWPSGFVESYDRDIDLKNGFANAMIHLSKLNVPRMISELNALIHIGEGNEWHLKERSTSLLTSSMQNSASFAYKLLEISGILSMYKSASQSGPSSKDFYCTTNCHLGDRLDGFFNPFPWRPFFIAPKLVHHLAASAAEIYDKDREATADLMLNTDLVEPTVTMTIKKHLENH